MNLYAVFQQGVYRHDCVGVFDTLDLAVAAADGAAEAEIDNHHSFEVFQYVLNQQAGEGNALYRVRRNEALEKRQSGAV